MSRDLTTEETAHIRGGKNQVKCAEIGALCPSKSGLMNKHIVKHINVSEDNISFLVPCARLSPDL